MKFGKITTGTISQNALAMGGAVAGGALSGGLMTLVPQEQQLVARCGMAAVGLVGAASIKGKSSIDNLVKMVLLGVGIKQGAELVKHFAAQAITIDETATASTKFVGGMAGLACPGAQDFPASLASPVINFEALPAGQTYDAHEEVGMPSGAF